MDDIHQSDHLLVYFKNMSFELKRATDPGDFIDWLYRRIAPQTLNEIVTWLGESNSSKNNRQLA